MQPPFRYSFTLADRILTLQTARPITVTDPFLPFLTEAEGDYTAVFREVPALPDITGEPVYTATSYTVVRDSDKEYRHVFRDAAHEDTPPYAVSRFRWNRRQVTVDYLPEGRGFVSETGNCFFHTDWERILLREKRLILHAACVDTSLGGILFSGRSGIGKSTQAELWCRYAAARQINGDRPILYKKDGVWTAFGSPYAGSSKCHISASTPVKAVVMLGQAKTCTIRRLGAAEAFRKIFSGLTVSAWDPACVTEASGLAAELVSDIPVYELACTPDQSAVGLLRRVLLGGETG